MRYVGILIFLVMIPLLANAISSDIRVRRGAWVALGAAPYVYPAIHFSVSIISWAYWPGYVKGMVIALPDLLAISLLMSTRRRKAVVPVILALSLYIVAAATSIIVAELPMASFFYFWQLLRILLVAIAVGRISADPQAPRHIVTGLCYGIICQAGFSIYERVVHGVLQASGTMGHQNLLGMMTHFSLLSALALMLSGDRRLILKIGIAASLITVALTGSRGTAGFAAFGMLVLLTLSLIRAPSPWKYKVIAAGLGGLLIMSPLVYLTLSKRFQEAISYGNYDERAAFAKAATLMRQDHPFGVGANEYVVVANTGGYNKRGGVAWVSGSLSANVHNAYLLNAAEMGWFGWVSFIVLFATIACHALKTAWRRPSFMHSDLALGLFAIVITIALHSLYEWIFVVEATEYLFAIVAGLAMGLRLQQIAIAAQARRGAAEARMLETLPKPHLGHSSMAHGARL